MIMESSPVLRVLLPSLSRLRSLAQLRQQAMEIVDYVAPGGLGLRDALHAGAAHDRRVRADLAERVDVAALLDAEADRDRRVGLRAQALDHRLQGSRVRRADGAAASVRGHQVDVRRAVLRSLVEDPGLG